jgi:SAM-dependent methyltransferase
MTTRIGASFFEQKYRRDPDPWRFASSAYERHRYASIVNDLGSRHFERAFEPGCSIGVLTSKLAPRCESLIAMDVAPSAIRAAKLRCRRFPNVKLVLGSVAENIPVGSFDLIVFSEIGYYFSEENLRGLTAKLVAKLSPGGTFLAAHWLGESRDHVLSGRRVHAILGSLPDLRHAHGRTFEGFRLDRWSAHEHPSLAYCRAHSRV